jgi:hypothetical protein
MGDIVQGFIEKPFLSVQYILFNNASVGTSSSTSITSKDDGGKGSSERQRRSWKLLSAALLNTAHVKEPYMQEIVKHLSLLDDK